MRATINAFILTRYDAAALSRHIGIARTVRPICRYVGGRGSTAAREKSRDSRKKIDDARDYKLRYERCPTEGI